MFLSLRDRSRTGVVAGSVGWLQRDCLSFGLVDVAVNVTDVSVGSRRTSHASVVCAAMGKEGRRLMPVGAAQLSSILVV